MKMWESYGISTESYATFVPRPAGAERELLSRLLPALKVAARAVDHLALPLNVGADLWPLPAVSIPALLVRIGFPAMSVPAVLGVLNRDPKLMFDLFQALCADPDGKFRH